MTLAMLSVISCNDFLKSFDPDNNPNGSYESAWVEKYGAVKPNQNWDLSSPMPVFPTYDGKIEDLPEFMPSAVAARQSVSAAGVVAQEGETGYFNNPSSYLPFVAQGLKPIKTLDELSYLRTAFALENQRPISWESNKFKTHDMWDLYYHTPSVVPSAGANYAFGIKWHNPAKGMFYAMLYLNSKVSAGNSPNTWYTNTRVQYGMDGGRRFIGESLAEMEDVQWCAYDSKVSGFVTTNMGDYPLENYVEVVTPTGAKYWGFDCNHDGDYSDKVVLVEPSSRQVKTTRYLIEDQGAKKDFDFNDIVVDVTQERIINYSYNGNTPVQEFGPWTQTAVIRALGGSIDFELTIGETTFRKSDKFEAGKMYNSFEPDVNAVLHEYTVTGWNPNTNNISVKVLDGTSGGVRTITFPKEGVVPVIIAVDPDVKWMNESVSIPSSWFTIPE